MKELIETVLAVLDERSISQSKSIEDEMPEEIVSQDQCCPEWKTLCHKVQAEWS